MWGGLTIRIPPVSAERVRRKIVCDNVVALYGL
jgi:hypothetical protein